MNNIGVIGDLESVQGFRALGLTVFPCDSAEEAHKSLKDMADKGYYIIYIVEDLAVKLAPEIEKYSDDMIPAIIPIPGNRGSLGYGKAQLDKSVEKAVGVNILKDT